MRRLIGLAVLVPLLWCGWWLFASDRLESGLEQWFADRRAEGWQAEVSGIDTGGFPLDLEKTLREPMLADPRTGVAFSTEALRLTTRAWWPGIASVTFPGEEILLASPLQSLTIAPREARADLALHPGPRLELREMAATSGPWEMTTPQGRLMRAEGLTLRMAQAEEAREVYAFTLDAPAFQPGALMRAALRIPADWPVAFDSLALQATVGFDRPFDRTTIEDARPQPRRIDLARAEAAWGSMLLRAAAGLDITPQGVASGEVTLQARNWREMLSLAATAGVLPPSLLPQMETILDALARGSGNPEALDVTLTVQDGVIYLGFIPLGRAPLIVLR
jgi:hypothetical protein